MKKRLVYSGLLVIVCVLALCSGCIAGDHEEEQVKPGDTVLVHYTGTFDNGTVFDTSAGRDPLQFSVGNGEMIQGFDEGVVGMRVGEEKTLHIPADRAYGQYREDLVITFGPDEIGNADELAVGDQIWISLQNGQILPATVVAVSVDSITIDANHHLAGEDLTFSVHLIGIQ